MTIEAPVPASPIAQREFREDLLDLASYEFRTAQTQCGDCADYHALFGYGRLAGLHDGINRDEETLAPLLGSRLDSGAKLLIACAADAGLLALAARATIAKSPAISVADRCATPLAVCRRFAETENLRLRTIQSDFSKAALGESFDVALAHNVLLFVPESLQVNFLRNVGRSLSDAGVLILVSRGALPQQSGKVPTLYRTHGNILAALSERGIALPEEELLFRQRLERLDEGRRRALAPMQLHREKIEATLDAAGFNIVERIRHERRRLEGSSEIVPTFIFIAAFVRH